MEPGWCAGRLLVFPQLVSRVFTLPVGDRRRLQSLIELPEDRFKVFVLPIHFYSHQFQDIPK